MKFNYSYRAFLITCLLFGILFLAFKSITLSKYTVIKEDLYDVEYALEEIIQEEPKDVALTIPSKTTIKTHKAYNEAEKFISAIENERTIANETTQSALEAMNEAIKNSNTPAGTIKTNNRQDISEKKLNTESKTENIPPISQSNDKNSTNSYRLVGRKTRYFPNPIYTCDGFGKIVINIVVNDKGKVINTTYNQKSSTTNNACLIDSALKYAKKSRFTKAKEKSNQLGSISYVFLGQ